MAVLRYPWRSGGYRPACCVNVSQHIISLKKTKKKKPHSLPGCSYVSVSDEEVPNHCNMCICCLKGINKVFSSHCPASLSNTIVCWKWYMHQCRMQWPVSGTTHNLLFLLGLGSHGNMRHHTSLCGRKSWKRGTQWCDTWTWNVWTLTILLKKETL